MISVGQKYQTKYWIITILEVLNNKVVYNTLNREDHTRNTWKDVYPGVERFENTLKDLRYVLLEEEEML